MRFRGEQTLQTRKSSALGGRSERAVQVSQIKLDFSPQLNRELFQKQKALNFLWSLKQLSEKKRYVQSLSSCPVCFWRNLLQTATAIIFWLLQREARHLG